MKTATDPSLFFTKIGFNHNDLKYRQSTVAMVIDDENRVLIVQKKNYNNNEWDMPGGGVHTDKGEIPEDALLRELNEELGLTNFKILKKSKNIEQYEWPDDVIIRKFKEKGQTWRGQQRTQFLVKFTGNKSKIVYPPNEINDIKWVSVDNLERYMIFPDQWNKTQLLINEFLN